MTELQILQLIMESSVDTNASLEFLVTDFARRLAKVSDRLSEDEVISLAAIAAFCYKRGSDEFISGVSVDLLLKSMKNKRR